MPADAETPSLDPRYEYLETLGRGGMGAVHKVRDRVLGRIVALKTLHDAGPAGLDDADRRRFEREIRALGLLHHDGIVRLHDVGRWDGRVYFTMELLEGLPLEALLAGPPPGPEEVRWFLRVGLRVAEALDHLHRSGFVHRDLKPSNIIVLRTGGTSGEPTPAPDLLSDPDPRVKLLDFGLVKPREGAAAGGPPPGTPLYMAPEQMDPSAAPDARSDLYSLGVVLYQALTRRLPHATVASALSGRPPAPPEALDRACPPGLPALLLRLLERQPHRRFASARELARALRSSLSGRPLEEPPPRLLAPAFVGREEQAAALQEGLREAAAGRGRLVLVAGGRGAGKSWLLEQSGLKARAVLEHGVTYFCGSYTERGLLHQGLREAAHGMLLDLARDPGAEALPELLGPWGGSLLRLLGIQAIPGLGGAWVDRPADDSPELESERALQAGSALFAAACRRPRLVLLDDLHLADDLDLDLLARVARGIRALPLLLVATYRADAVESSPGLLRLVREAQSGGSEAVERLHLEAFTDGEAAQLVRSMLSPPADVDPGLVGEVLDRTGGSPRALEEALGELWAAGRIRQDGGVWRLLAGGSGPHLGTGGGPPEPGPDPLEELEALDREVLAAASVLGECFAPEPLPALIGGSGRGGIEERVTASLHALAARGLLAETRGGFAFARAGLRERIEGLLDEGQRRALHARAAAVLEELAGEEGGDHAEGIAYHHARAGSPARALDLYLKAARRAARHYANRRALGALRAALALAEGAARGEVAGELGRLHARAGEYQKALECYELALREGQGGSAALLQEIGLVHQRRGELKRALECFERSLEHCGGDRHLLARAQNLLGGVRFDEGSLDDAARHFQASLELARQLGDLGDMGSAYTNLGLVEKRREALAAAAGHFREAIDCAERGAKISIAAHALNNLGTVHRARGEDAEAIECFRRSIALRERIGDRMGLAGSLINISRLLAHRGETAAAAEAAASALGIFEEAGNQKGVLRACENLGAFRLLLGDLRGARRAFERAWTLAGKLGDRRAQADSIRGLGRIACEEGDAAEGERRLREALRLLEDETDADLRSGILADLARVRIALGDLEGARDAAEEGLGHGGGGGGAARGLLLTALSEIDLQRGDPERAVERARAAIEGLGRSGPRLETALAHRQLGRAYREMGPDWVDRAEKHFGESLKILEPMGARIEAALTIEEAGDLWYLLGEAGEAGARYHEAETALLELDAPARLREVRERIARVEEEAGR